MFHVKHQDMIQDGLFNRKIEVYIEELLRWNKRINLVGRNDSQWVYKELIMPVFKIVDWVEKGSVVELGAGSGVTGIVLKLLVPEIELTLVERREKKCVFLRYIRQKLGMDYNVLCENAGKGMLCGYDFLILRGVKIEDWHRGIARSIIYFGEPGKEWEIKEVKEWRKGRRIYLLKGIV